MMNSHFSKIARFLAVMRTKKEYEVEFTWIRMIRIRLIQTVNNIDL